MELSELKKQKVVENSPAQLGAVFTVGAMTLARNVKKEIDDMRVYTLAFSNKPKARHAPLYDCTTILFNSIDDIQIV